MTEMDEIAPNVAHCPQKCRTFELKVRQNEQICVPGKTLVQPWCPPKVTVVKNFVYKLSKTLTCTNMNQILSCG